MEDNTNEITPSDLATIQARLSEPKPIGDIAPKGRVNQSDEQAKGESCGCSRG